MLLRNLRLTKHCKKPLLLLLSILLLTTLLLSIRLPLPKPLIRLYYWIRPDQGVFCHSMRVENSLPDIARASPKKGRSIFFHETSCNSFINGKVTINSRQACAVESAARLHPDHEVYLLYASPGRFLDDNSESDRFLKALLKYPNVNVFHVDMERYTKGTPVEQLWTGGKLRESRYAQSHTSDILRFLTLWKFGGIYLDLDVIVIKNLEDLGTDYAGVESERAVAAGILSFNYTGAGHDYAKTCLEDLRENFNGNDWGYNGPGTVTRLLKKLCNVSKVEKMLDRNCKGFAVYPPKEFYAVPWWNWSYFFEKKHLGRVLEYANSSHIMHVWNRFSVSRKIPLDSKAAYLSLAIKYCPSVVQQCDNYF